MYASLTSGWFNSACVSPLKVAAAWSNFLLSWTHPWTFLLNTLAWVFSKLTEVSMSLSWVIFLSKEEYLFSKAYSLLLSDLFFSKKLFNAADSSKSLLLRKLSKSMDSSFPLAEVTFILSPVIPVSSKSKPYWLKWYFNKGTACSSDPLISSWVTVFMEDEKGSFAWVSIVSILSVNSLKTLFSTSTSFIDVFLGILTPDWSSKFNSDSLITPSSTTSSTSKESEYPSVCTDSVTSSTPEEISSSKFSFFFKSQADLNILRSVWLLNILFSIPCSYKVSCSSGFAVENCSKVVSLLKIPPFI